MWITSISRENLLPLPWASRIYGSSLIMEYLPSPPLHAVGSRYQTLSETPCHLSASQLLGFIWNSRYWGQIRRPDDHTLLSLKSDNAALVIICYPHKDNKLHSKSELITGFFFQRKQKKCAVKKTIEIEKIKPVKRSIFGALAKRGST